MLSSPEMPPTKNSPRHMIIFYCLTFSSTAVTLGTVPAGSTLQILRSAHRVYLCVGIDIRINSDYLPVGQ
jgi:hypothetical protein